mmetsp:Transcript_38480/g.80625  ORF Transcript_38480/g.80625 Transcript_38480/m.80625 type:complete len:209 (-) Transcript_38480:78-704(-)
MHVIPHHMTAPLLFLRKLVPSFMPNRDIPVIIPFLLIPSELFYCVLNMWWHFLPRMMFVLVIPRGVVPSQCFTCFLLLVIEVPPAIVINIDPLVFVPLPFIEADQLGGLARGRWKLGPRDIHVLGFFFSKATILLHGGLGGGLRVRRAGFCARFRTGLGARLRSGGLGRGLPAGRNASRGVGVLLLVLAKYLAEDVCRFSSLFSHHGD